nr:hypothetical protein [uncultured Kingella sp.]
MPIKTIVPIALLFAAAIAQAEPLYFYAQKDKIGVKTASGRIVIAPVKVMLPDAHHYAKAKRPIRGHTIEICFSEHFNENRDDAIAADVGDVFSRTGQYLYSPIEYDNGCDYWQEGMRRYVEKGRVGFVRRDGSRATPALWDFADPFHHGYATVYRGGWKKEWTDDEHWTLAPAAPDAVSEVINQKGEVVAGSSLKTAADDIKRDGLYYPNPYRYTPHEQRIADYFNRLTVLQRLVLCNKSSPADADELNVRYHIVERPNAAQPYYRLQSFYPNGEHAGERAADTEFLVSVDGKRRFAAPNSVFADEYDAPIPLARWIREQLLQARDYLRKNPKAPNRFDVNKELRRWR